METLRKGCAGNSVAQLQELLKKQGYPVGTDGVFGEQTRTAVRMLQEKSGLTADGIVGRDTWNALTGGRPTENAGQEPSLSAGGRAGKETALDFRQTAEILGVEEAAVQAVCDIESGGRTGFLKDGRPMILFEGHIFWKELKKRGIDPEKYRNEYKDVLFPKWDRSAYKGGAQEYERLGKASRIDEEAALCSASWGMFQIMGFNHKLCGYDSVREYVEAVKSSPNNHLVSFARFLKSTGIDKPLKNLDWEGFASRYNGPGYKQNSYDTKLRDAYLKHKQN